MWLEKRKNQIRKNTGLLPVALIVMVISSDQYTKYLAGKFLTTANEVAFLNNVFQFTLMQNHGGFLGIVNDLSENGRFFLLTVCVSALLLGCLLYLFGCHKRTFRYDIPLALVIGGGLGNLLDRLLHDGGVTDFLSIGVDNFRTGIFNFADAAILIGSFILGYTIFSSPSDQEQKSITDP